MALNPNKIYKVAIDPGHGWMAVKLAELVELGIHNEISTYSYVKGKTAYLEEDMDMDTFFKAFEKRFGKTPEFVVKNYKTSCPIRSYRGYTPGYVHVTMDT